MIEHSQKKARGPHRRLVFKLWIWITVFLAAFLMIALPMAAFFADQYRHIAAIVPPVMIALTVIGVGWLVWLVTAKKRR